jgi:CspA family cold shock protein
MWIAVASRRTRDLYVALLVLAAALGGAAVALADDVAMALLAGAVAAVVLAVLWREVATRRALTGGEIQMIGNGGEVEYAGDPPGPYRDPNAITVERGRVESWDDETGWGVLSADLPNGGVFAHFSVVEGEGYRTLKPGDAVTFDYTPEAGGPGSQDGCSYVAERVAKLDEGENEVRTDPS